MRISDWSSDVCSSDLYSTLYGDTAGGFAVIKDVPKLLVYDLCRLRNERAGRELVPESVLTKPPSAELRPDQRDDQSLPPYEVLDPLLEAYVELDLTRGEIIASGRSEEHTSELQSLMRISYAVFCLKKKKNKHKLKNTTNKLKKH